MSQKIVIGGKGELELLDVAPVHADYLDLSWGYDVEELMDIYEVIDPDKCRDVRDRLIALEPDVIVVIGKSPGYRWNATVIARLFGQFTSWRNQTEQPYGKTVIPIAGKEVVLYAIASLDGWDRYIELS